MNEAIEKLNCILGDSIILRMDFTVEAVGSDVEEVINFSSEDLYGQSFTSICQNSKLTMLVKEKLKMGYFDNLNASLLNRRAEVINVVISGFYLGLISDLNGYIILKIKVIENASLIEKELAERKSEIDSFIYRTAHDLRGPLATIKGLVNLLKIRKDDIEVDELTALVEIHANKLDDRLFKLLYMADVGDLPGEDKGCINFSELEVGLRKLLTDNCQLDKARFVFDSAITELEGFNEVKVNQLLSSILLYIISLPIASLLDSRKVKIHMKFSLAINWLEIEITSLGFAASSKVQSLIGNSTSLYNDLLANPYLFNYYVAQKRALQMGALIKVDFYNDSEQILKVLIPKNNNSIKEQNFLKNTK